MKDIPNGAQRDKPERSGRHREMESGGWAWFHLAALGKARECDGARGVALYAALALWESRTPREFKKAFKASAANLESVSGLSARTIHRALPILERAGLVQIHSGRSRGPARAHEANTFTLLDVSSGAAAPAPYVTETQGPCVTESQAYDTESRRDGRHKRNSKSFRKKEGPPPALGLTPPAEEATANDATKKRHRLGVWPTK
jgi:hypothetical protein